MTRAEAGSAPASGVATQLRLIPAGVGVGAIAGVSAAGFLRALEWVTDRQVATSWLVWLLPASGLLVGLVNQRWGGRATAGNRLVMAEVDSLGAGVPVRMAPLALAGTLITHLTGGSAGREGTALQMAAGLTDGLGSRFGLPAEDRRSLLVASLSAGFGAVFGVPWAGFVFGLEVAPTSWRRRLRALPACLGASWFGDLTVGWMGVKHRAYQPIAGVGVRDIVVVAIVAPAFGIAAWLFLRLTAVIASGWTRYVRWSPLHPMFGGIAVVGLTVALGTRDYNGLSLPLIDRSFGLIEIGLGVWLVKLVMTAVTVGSGFAGGEVTPLFVIGATLGAAIGHATGEPVALLSAVGLVATFGAAANAPWACIVMGLELFGFGGVVPLAVGCAVARLCSSKHSIYDHGPNSDPVTVAVGGTR